MVTYEFPITSSSRSTQLLVDWSKKTLWSSIGCPPEDALSSQTKPILEARVTEGLFARLVGAPGTRTTFAPVAKTDSTESPYTLVA